MKPAVDYTFSNHPLKRVSEAGLLPYFRKERCVVVCPLCRAMLYEYRFKRTGQKCFYLCPKCAWFNAVSTLFEVLHQVERQPAKTLPAGTISGILDSVLKPIVSSEDRRRWRYKNLGGQMRHDAHAKR